MARVPRKLCIIENFSVHKVWRGHNKEFNLGTASQKEKYLEYLNDDIESERFKNACELQALTLMGNHTHEVDKILSQKLFSEHMRRHHSRYGMYFNRSNDRCGKVAQDRPHTCVLEDSEHEMLTVFYVHANPIRANIVGDARNYYYSTHNLYAFGKRKPWMKHVVLPAWYMALGKNMTERQKRYRELFAKYLRDYGLYKRNFLKRHFFGTSAWMDAHEDLVKQWRKEHSSAFG